MVEVTSTTFQCAKCGRYVNIIQASMAEGKVYFSGVCKSCNTAGAFTLDEIRMKLEEGLRMKRAAPLLLRAVH
jgi:hypothetical protein